MSGNSKRRKAKKRPPNPELQARVAAAVKAYQASANEWPRCIDEMSVATWRGVEICWPSLDGEAFDIVRVADSAVLSHEALPCDEAHRLDWQWISLDPPAEW